MIVDVFDREGLEEVAYKCLNGDPCKENCLEEVAFKPLKGDPCKESSF